MTEHDPRGTVTLWRPVGPQELDLIRASGMRAFPPRLPEQPIFYPVLSEEYAITIARALAPDNPEVLHALGCVRWRSGALAAADHLIAEAIARDPTQAAWHDHHGLVLAALGDFAAGEAAHRRALALAPHMAAAHNNLA